VVDRELRTAIGSPTGEDHRGGMLEEEVITAAGEVEPGGRRRAFSMMRWALGIYRMDIVGWRS
jgi:hypothetical protein